MKKRIFIAIDISGSAKRKVAEYIEDLKGEFRDLKAGWEKAEKLHLTLKFIGDVETSKITELIKAIETASKEFTKFAVKIERNGVFPNAKKARILWLGLNDEKGILRKINEFVEKECVKIGFSAEKKSFKPHLTIARLREPQKSGELVKKHLEKQFEPVEFEVSEIVIYESKLLPTGSIYFPVAKIPI